MTTDCQALRWIAALLRRIDVPFQAVGGLAAQADDTRRPLADLVFYIPTSRLDDVADEAGDFVSRPPLHFRSDCWDSTGCSGPSRGESAKRQLMGRRVELTLAAAARRQPLLTINAALASIPWHQSHSPEETSEEA
jgi:hypothetical protein